MDETAALEQRVRSRNRTDFEGARKVAPFFERRSSLCLKSDNPRSGYDLSNDDPSVIRAFAARVLFFILNRFLISLPNQDATTGYAFAQGMQGGRVVVEGARR